MKYTQEQKELLAQEYKLAESLAQGAESEFGKLIISILDNSITASENEWNGKGLNSIDDAGLVIFRSAVRSKLQTLKAFRRKLTEAKDEQERIGRELDVVTKYSLAK